MRILQIIHDFLPRHVGGSQVYCLYLSRELARRHSVWLLYTETDHQAPQYAVSRGETLGLPSFQVVHNGVYRSFEQTYADHRMDEVFTRVLDEVRPEVVHIHHLMRHSVNYVAIARARGIPVVFTLHDYWLSCPNQGQRLRRGARVCETVNERDCAVCIGRFSGPAQAVTRLASAWRGSIAREPPTDAFPESGAPAGGAPLRGLPEARRVYHALEGLLSRATGPLRVGAVKRRLRHVRRMSEMVDLFLAPSAFVAATMAEFGLPASRLVYSEHGMRHDIFPPRPAPDAGACADGGPRPMRFGYVGALAPHKGVHLLISAFHEVCRGPGGHGAHLKVHGNLHWDAAYVASLRRLAERAPVEFLGEFDPGDAGRVYAGLDVLVVPSIWWENAPLTVDEARLAGVPVIASRIGGLAESIRHGIDGLLFRPGDVGDLAARMGDILRNPAMLRGAPARLPAKSIEADAQDLEERYRHLLSGRRRKTPHTGPHPSRAGADPEEGRHGGKPVLA